MRKIAILFFVLNFYYVFCQTSIEDCPVFPANNIWNTPINNLPVHPNSSNFINAIGKDLSLRNDFGSGLWNNAPIGIPYVLVGDSQLKSQVTFEYSDESDKVLYPIPNNPPIEGGNESTGDRHIIMIDTSDCKLYELYSAYQNNDGSWRAGSGAVYDLNSNNLREIGWTSADAAGLPIYPGLVKYDEMIKGEINHTIRFTVPKTKREYLWPARHFASSITDNNYPPMGLVMRLKKSYDIEKLSPQGKVIAKALQTYGMILADNGSPWFMSGVPDERWDMDDLYTLRQIKGADFEAVDISSLIININSGEVKNEVSSIDDFGINENSIIISPNPTSDYIEISLGGINPTVNRGVDENVEIKIYNTFGKCVIKYELRNTNYEENYRVDISHLPTGVYFVRIGNYSEKFMMVR